ncbi:ArdC family protein [Cnuibacter physcomitrellae]|uniref:ArdC family protein n=1 Tax=Cnuibacter physcomitrellae TaxID=1619308 RepID=UPI002175A9F9|nr:ArdC family protein [Cnuibacter physcomitrellae]MCS5498209.1 ArdC family protein [Cnuibacter physcomitrellae]
MARTVKNSKSAQQRRAEAEALQATITEQIEQLRESGAWERFLGFAQSFHHYSLGNLLLILAQRPDATCVAGYRSWQARNRQVRKGERGIRIFGGRTVRETIENESGEEEEQSRVRFFPVTVFDMAQTDLIDAEVGDPTDISCSLTGDDPAGIFDAVSDYLTGLGWTVERDNIPGGAHGITTTDGSRRVVIGVGLAAAQAAKTALHEAAHVLLHVGEDPSEYVEHRGVKETEAESVAYIVAGILGLDTSAYSVGYIAGWSDCDADTIKATAANVLRTAHHLADAITEPTPAAEPAPAAV